MRFVIADHNKNRNIISLLRQAGYHFEKEHNSGEISFFRPVHGGAFPRFHIYLKTIGDGWEANLHLDQKKPSYSGTAAHAGECEGRVVEEEVRRVDILLNKI